MAVSLKVLSQIVVDRGRPEEARQLIDEATHISEQAWPASHWQRAMLQLTRGEIPTVLGRFEEADRELFAAQDVLRAKFGAHDYRVLDALKLRENLRAKRGKDDPEGL